MMLVAAWLVRWIGFVALAGLIGGLVVDLLVLPAGKPELASARRRLRTLRLAAVVALLLAGVAELWLRAVTMSGGPAAVWAALPVVLGRTHFGAVWIARVAGLGVLCLLAWASAGRVRALEALLVLGVALSVSLTGHAANWGDASAAVGSDWMHVVAAMAWTGGIFVLAALLLRDAGRLPGALVAAMMQRFSRLAGWCLLAVALSGAYSVWMEVPTVASLWQTAYGRLLAAKLLLVLGVAGCGAFNRYVVLPRLGVGRTTGLPARFFRLGRTALLGSTRAARPSSSSRVTVYVAREAALALLIFSCTAALVETTPSRHARHLEHGAASSGRPHTAGAELHAAGHGAVGGPLPSPAARVNR